MKTASRYYKKRSCYYEKWSRYYKNRNPILLEQSNLKTGRDETRRDDPPATRPKQSLPSGELVYSACKVHKVINFLKAKRKNSAPDVADGFERILRGSWRFSASGSTMALIRVITISIMQAESSHKCLRMTDCAGQLAQTLLANQHQAGLSYQRCL